LSVFMLTISGCQSPSIKENEDMINIEKIENTTQIVIGYGTNSYVVIIKDKEKIKQLEDLFNGAEFTKSDDSIQQPFLRISFSAEKNSTQFCIDDNDVVRFGDDTYIKSQQISFSNLHSIFIKRVR